MLHNEMRSVRTRFFARANAPIFIMISVSLVCNTSGIAIAQTVKNVKRLSPGASMPILRPLYGAVSAPVVAKPKTFLQAGIEENKSLKFGAILLKENGDFPKGFLGVPFPASPPPVPAAISLRVPRPHLEGSVEQAGSKSVLKGSAETNLIPAHAAEVSSIAPVSLNVANSSPQDPLLHKQEPQSGGSTVSEPTPAVALNSQSSVVSTPGWMSSETTTQTTWHQGDYGEQQKESQTVNQTTTESDVTQTIKEKRTSSKHSRSGRSLSIDIGITGLFMHGGKLFTRANNLINGAGFLASNSLNKITSPINKIEIATTIRISKAENKINSRLDKVQRAVTTRVNKVTNVVTNTIDRTISRGGSYLYPTTNYMVNQVWHPGSFQQVPDQYPQQQQIVQAPTPADETIQGNQRSQDDLAVTPIPTVPTNVAIDSLPITPTPAVAPLALNAVPASISMQTKNPPHALVAHAGTLIEAQVNWDPWYRDLISELCTDWSSTETHPGRLDLLVTIRRDGKIACEPTPPQQRSVRDATNDVAMLKRAESVINSVAEQPATHFPGRSQRKSVTFEVEFVSSTDPLNTYMDNCRPDVERIALSKH